MRLLLFSPYLKAKLNSIYSLSDFNTYEEKDTM